MRKVSSRIQLSGDRDAQLLMFLWKWKVSTTALLTRRFFPDAKPATAYRRLWTLAKGGFIQALSNRCGTKFVWTLGKRGHGVVKGRLGAALKEEGYLAEHVGHDLLSAAFHLGDWALAAPPHVKLFSEQQLRRYEQESYPAYVPKMGDYWTDEHRPDGYIRIDGPSSPRTIAVEVEINLKRKSWYGRVQSFYRFSKVDTVLWLAPKVSAATELCRLLEEGTARSESPHSFVAFPDFMRHGWGAVVRGGRSDGHTVRAVLGVPDNSLTTTAQPVVTAACLNLAKSPHKSKACKLYELGDFSD